MRSVRLGKKLSQYRRKELVRRLVLGGCRACHGQPRDSEGEEATTSPLTTRRELHVPINSLPAPARANGWVILDSAWADRLGAKRIGGVFRIRRRGLVQRLGELDRLQPGLADGGGPPTATDLA
jgi:hypothetical protein